MPVNTAPTKPEIMQLPCLSSPSFFCKSNDIVIGEVVRQLLCQEDTGHLKTSAYSTGCYFYVVVFQHIPFKVGRSDCGVCISILSSLSCWPCAIKPKTSSSHSKDVVISFFKLCRSSLVSEHSVGKFHYFHNVGCSLDFSPQSSDSALPYGRPCFLPVCWHEGKPLRLHSVVIGHLKAAFHA